MHDIQAAIERIREAAGRLDTWIEREGFKGWDPHDALNSPLLKRLTFGRRLPGIAWVQLVKRSPLNLRPLLGVPKGYNPKGMGLFLASYLRKYRMSKDARHREQARFFADWLRANRAPGYHGAGWGYHFDWPNRGFFAPAGTPTIVNTAFIGLAGLDGAEIIPDGLEIARSACDFMLRDLHSERPAADELAFSYTPLDRRFVHNASLMGAWLLAEVAARTGEPTLAEHALAAARYTARRQRADGAWPYGAAANDGWIDNFHTGYVLVALKRIGACLGTDAFDEAIARGYQLWKTGMFLADGTPKYYLHKVYPIDAHCVAQAILTFLAFAGRDGQALEWARKVALWGITHMQDRRGYFHYQIYPRSRIRIPYMRWTQAWMQRGLVELLVEVTCGKTTPA